MEAPDEGGVAARRDRCEARDPRRRPVVRRDCGKRITRDVERGVGALARPAAVLEPPGERRELGCERRELHLLPLEGGPAPPELEHPVAADRVELDRQPFGALVEPGTNHRRRVLVRLDTQPFELRREPRRQ